MTIATELLAVELLSRLLARRTEPGWSHIILSEPEVVDQLRSVIEAKLIPDDDRDLVLRALRNQLVHEPIARTQLAQWPRRVTRTLDRSRLETLVEACVTTSLRDRDDMAAHLEMAEAVANAFVEQLTSDADVLGKLDADEAARLGKRAADQVLASARWSQVIGDRLDTTQVTRLLGVSRQALAKRQATGSLLGVPGHATTWYPTWQFEVDVDGGRIHPLVRDLIGAFRDRLDDVDPLVIATWATTHQDEDLAGDTPAQWLRAGRDPDQLRRAAERAAARLAR